MELTTINNTDRDNANLVNVVRIILCVPFSHVCGSGVLKEVKNEELGALTGGG